MMVVLDRTSGSISPGRTRASFWKNTWEMALLMSPIGTWRIRHARLNWPTAPSATVPIRSVIPLIRTESTRALGMFSSGIFL